MELLLLVLFASDGALSSLRLALPWNADKMSSSSSVVADHTANVAANTTEPSVVDFDKINSRFMMLSQQNGYGFVVAKDLVNLS